MRGYGGGAPKVRPATRPGEPENVVFKAKEEPKEGMVESACESAAALALICHEGYVSPEEERHRKLLRMLGHVKDAIASRLDELPTRRDLYRAMALAGYNSSTNPNISGEDPGLKAIWAKDDAEAMLALGSEDETT
jgi:hypothetical protein